MLANYNVHPYLVNGQHRISVTIIGAGGTGSLIVTKLARLHEAMVKLEHPGLFVTLVDDDVVEEHNVGRQLFTSNDVGYHKSDILISKINAAFGFDWEAKIRRFKPEDSICNILISCVDNVASRQKIIDDFYNYDPKNHSNRDFRKRIHFIDCGNGPDFGQVILSDHECILPNINQIIPNWKQQDTVEQQGHSCSYIESLREQDLFVNDWVSLFAVDLIKKLLFDKQLSVHGAFFNSKNYAISELKVKHERIENSV